MNIPEYIKLAKQVLNEAAGSEGMQYVVKAKSGLNAVANNIVKIEDVKHADGIITAKALFAYPHDYGFALQTIKELLPNIDQVVLELVY